MKNPTIPNGSSSLPTILIARSLCGLLLAGLLIASPTVTRACPGHLPFESQGPLVAVPAFAAGLTAAAPGAAAGWLVGLPFKKADEFAIAGGLVPFVAASAAVGAPLYVVKKVAYDAPKALGHRIHEQRHKVAAN